MSDINKQARDKLKSAAAKAADNFDPNMFVETRDVLALLDELEAKDSTIATQQQEIRTLLNALGQASEKRNAEQADIIAKQEKWIKDVEETMISATDRAEAAEKRIAELERKEQHSERQSVIDALAGSGEEWSDIEEYMQKWDAERASAAGKGE
ncbi:TPA: hypothetical protein ACQ7YS_000990 [Escherichia coli]